MEHKKRTTKMNAGKLMVGIAMVPLPVLVFFIIAGALFPSGGFLYTLMLATLVYLMGLATIGTINLTQKNQKTITLKVKK